MFTLVSDESSQNLGIEVHKLRFYSFQTSLLAGKAVHDSTTKDFSLSVTPNLNALTEIARGDPENLRHSFDHARTQTIVIGRYPDLDSADMAIRGLDSSYETVLKNFGAAGRMLREDGNGRVLVEDPAASKARYGDAIISARTIQAFNMLQHGRDLDFNTLVGKIIPVFLSALGLREYKVGHDLKDDHSGKAQFTIDRIGMFDIYPTKDVPLINRYSFINGKFQVTASGNATSDFLQKHVFEWLVSAARDLNTIDQDALELRLDQVAKSVRDNWILKKTETPVLETVRTNVITLRP